MTQETAAPTIEIPGASLASDTHQAIVKPIVDASNAIYDQVLGAVQWYAEGWVDLVEEARAERAAARGVGSMGVVDLMDALPEAKVVSDLPGRVRLRLSHLKGQSVLAEQFVDTLDAVSGITDAHVSSLTSSILIHYDSEEYDDLAALLQAITAS